MKVEFNASEQFKRYAQQLSHKQKRFRRALEENTRTACMIAKNTAMVVTPHIGDGRPRGKNMITNSLQRAWQVRCEFVESNNGGTNGGREGENIYARIIISNRKKYAPFVQYGHKMTQHFVPWLYKDGSVLSRENTHAVKMFGLCVGTKTSYVPGVDMIGPTIAAFNKAFYELNEESLKKIFGR